MSPSRERGVSAITAIFLITMLALLAAASVQMWQGAQNDATLDLQWLRARQAALAGVQTGFWHAVHGVCPTNTPIIDLPDTLAPFTVSLTCTADGPYTDGPPPTITRYRIQAVACKFPSGAPSVCPNNAAVANDGYIEVRASGECVIQGAVAQCR